MNKFYDNIKSADSVVPTALQGDAVNFNGTNQYFACPSPPVSFPTNFWVYYAIRRNGPAGYLGILCTTNGINASTNKRTGIQILDYSRNDISAVFGYLQDIVGLRSTNTLSPGFTSGVGYKQILGGTGISDEYFVVDGISSDQVSRFPFGEAVAVPDNSAVIGRLYSSGTDPTESYFSGSMKTLALMTRAPSKSEARKIMNLGDPEAVYNNSEFHLLMKAENYDTGTGIWTDASPNAFIYTAVNSPTKSTFIP